MKSASREFSLGKTLLKVSGVNHRYADQVVLRDVNFEIRDVIRPDAITGQPFVCAGVGATNVRVNQSRVASEKTLSGSTRSEYSRPMVLWTL